MAQLTESRLTTKQRQMASVVTMLNAPKTPFSSMLKLEPTLKDKKWEQPVELYPDVGHKGEVDGRDVTVFNSQTGDTVTCVAQKLDHSVAVSDFTQNTETATVKKNGQLAEQVQKGLVLLKTKRENRFCSDAESKFDNGKDEGNETRGAFKWVQAEAQAHLPVMQKYRTPKEQVYNGTLADLDEDTLIKLFRHLFISNNGSVTNLKGFIGTYLMDLISTWFIYTKDKVGSTVTRQVNVDPGKKEIVRCVERIVVDGTSVDLLPTTQLLRDRVTGASTNKTHNSGLFVDMDKMAYAFLRPTRNKPLEDKGGGPRSLLDEIVMLVCKNPQAAVSVVATGS